MAQSICMRSLLTGKYPRGYQPKNCRCGKKHILICENILKNGFCSSDSDVNIDFDKCEYGMHPKIVGWKKNKIELKITLSNNRETYTLYYLPEKWASNDVLHLLNNKLKNSTVEDILAIYKLSSASSMKNFGKKLLANINESAEKLKIIKQKQEADFRLECEQKRKYDSECSERYSQEIKQLCLEEEKLLEENKQRLIFEQTEDIVRKEKLLEKYEYYDNIRNMKLKQKEEEIENHFKNKVIERQQNYDQHVSMDIIMTNLKEKYHNEFGMETNELYLNHSEYIDKIIEFLTKNNLQENDLQNHSEKYICFLNKMKLILQIENIEYKIKEFEKIMNYGIDDCVVCGEDKNIWTFKLSECGHTALCIECRRKYGPRCTETYCKKFMDLSKNKNNSIWTEKDDLEYDKIRMANILKEKQLILHEEAAARNKLVEKTYSNIDKNRKIKNEIVENKKAFFITKRMVLDMNERLRKRKREKELDNERSFRL
jgi:hypothetical protein